MVSFVIACNEVILGLLTCLVWYVWVCGVSTCLCVQDKEKNYIMTGYSVPYQMQTNNMLCSFQVLFYSCINIYSGQ